MDLPPNYGSLQSMDWPPQRADNQVEIVEYVVWY